MTRTGGATGGTRDLQQMAVAVAHYASRRDSMRLWTVYLARDGTVSCTCPGYEYSSQNPRHCRHVDAWLLTAPITQIARAVASLGAKPKVGARVVVRVAEARAHLAGSVAGPQTAREVLTERTEAVVRRVRAGEAQAAVARAFGLSKERVRQYMRGEGRGRRAKTKRERDTWQDI